jgi:hypothetical protein
MDHISIPRPAGRDQDLVKIFLKEGVNQINFMVVNAGGGFALASRLLSPHDYGVLKHVQYEFDQLSNE